MYIVFLASNYLSKKDFGFFTLIASALVFFGVLANFGQSQILMYKNGKYGAKVRSQDHISNVSTSLFITLILAIFFGMAGFFFIYFDLRAGHFLIAVEFALLVFVGAIKNFLAEESKTIFGYKLAAFLGSSGGIGSALSISIAILLMWFHKTTALLSLENIYSSLLIGGVISVIIMAVDFAKTDSIRKLFKAEHLFSSTSLKFMKMGFMSVMTSILVFTIGQGDLWLVSKFIGVEKAGSYGLAVYFARFLSLGGMLLSSSFSNRISIEINNDKTSAINYLQKYGKASLVSTLLTFILVMTLWKLEFINHFFKVDDTDFFKILLIASAGHIFAAYWSFGSVGLAVSARFKEHFFVSLISGLTSMLCALFLISEFGVIGVAFAYAFGYFMYSFCSFRYLKSKF